MAKLTKRQIKEGLEQVPIESLLSGKGQKVNLTPKQREFARNVALGKSKAQSYREAYNTEASSKVVSVDSSRLSQKPSVALAIEAYKEAIEAEKHRTPAQLRALVINELVKHAISEDIKPSVRLNALKLLGNVAEVGAFVERKESLVIHESAKVKADLMAKLKDIVGGEIRELQDDDGESLLAEISGAKNQDSSEPTHPQPPDEIREVMGADMHNVPLKQSSPNELQSASCKDPLVQDVDFKEEKNEVETFPLREGVGGSEISQASAEGGMGNTPHGNLDTIQKG